MHIISPHLSTPPVIFFFPPHSASSDSDHCSLYLAELDQTVRIFLYSLIFLLSVLGNTLVITVLIRNKRIRTVTNFFLLSLAISDLMLCFFCMPFTLIPNLLQDFIFGSSLCKITSYFMGESAKLPLFRQESLLIPELSSLELLAKHA